MELNCKNKQTVWLLNTIRICIGLLIAGLGIAIMYNVAWGSAQGATITQGVSVFTGLGYGKSSMITNSTFLVLLFFLDKSLIGMGTVIVTFFLGYFIDIGMFIVAPLQIAEMSFGLKVIMMFLGNIILASGFGYYVGVNFGTGPLDGIAVALNRKYNINFKIARWVSDGIIMLIGILLGASWGVGTLSCLILTAPIMDFIIKRVKKLKVKQK